MLIVIDVFDHQDVPYTDVHRSPTSIRMPEFDTPTACDQELLSARRCYAVSGCCCPLDLVYLEAPVPLRSQPGRAVHLPSRRFREGVPAHSSALAQGMYCSHLGLHHAQLLESAAQQWQLWCWWFAFLLLSRAAKAMRRCRCLQLGVLIALLPWYTQCSDCEVHWTAAWVLHTPQGMSVQQQAYC